MNIEVSLLAGQQLKANLGALDIISDQSVGAGGQAAYPEPFDYFLASMPLCAAFYMRKFCQQREINTDGLTIRLKHEVIDDSNPYKKHISMEVVLPEGFPVKYQKALIASANTCTVKKVIQALPEFTIAIATSKHE